MTCQYLRHSCTFLAQVICHNNSTEPLRSPRCRPGAALRITHLQISHFHKLPSDTDVRSFQPTTTQPSFWMLLSKTRESPSVAAACWITPTGLGEDPFYTSGAATRVQELGLIYFSPGATVSPLFSTHPEKGPCSCSSGVQRTLGSKMSRDLQTGVTV